MNDTVYGVSPGLAVHEMHTAGMKSFSSADRRISLRLGFRHTAFQAVCTVLVLCFAIGLLERADTVQPVFGEDSVRVPILMYHSILKDSARQGKYVISPAVLAADLDALQVKGYTAITVSDLLAYVQDGADLPEKPVMITFDDGHC